MIPDAYKKGCEKTAEMLSELELTSQDVYESVKHLDINWAKSLFDPLPESECVTVELQLPPRFVSSY